MKPVKLYVFKRDGRKEEVHFDKITSRIQKLCYGLNMDFVDPVSITLKVINGLYSGVTTQELDNLAAETAATMTTNHADYAILAARIAVSNLHKETKKAFSDVIHDLYNMVNSETGEKSPMITDLHYKVITDNADRLNSAIIYDRDFGYNYFGFKTLERSYLLKINGKIAERPQHMLMRVSVGIHAEDIDAAIETYNLLSERFFTHASPTLFAAATRRPQLSSCFLLTMCSDSIEGIFKSVEQCAMISKSAGGIGLNVHCIRATGTRIAGTNGISNGLVPMLRVFNNVARYVDQGGNKRPGAFAIYLEPWHSDIFEFLDLKKNTGKEENRARDLFYALWIPDLFMKRVESNGNWSLMCPHKCPGLHDVWGDEFEELYIKYEKEGRANRTIEAQKLWFAIIESQVETGTPYMLYKDACNRKSNQQNVGTIRCSNLCTEIVEYSAPDEIAVCNLASIALNQFVTMEKKYDFLKLKAVTKTVTRNLNKIIDINYYPLPEAKKSNFRHRPIGIGVQGLADAFILLRYPYESEEARVLNQQIFETIYYGALEASCELAELDGPYETYEGSPVSKGILQYDMWNKIPTDLWDWSKLKEKIAKHGVRNSLLIAPMPTASTAQILGNNESFEPYTSNIYNRRVLSGEFQIVNHHLLNDLTELDLWDEEMKNEIISQRGSIQGIERIPNDIRELYKTVWEISVRNTIEMAADRGAFIDQSQSFNVHIGEPNYGKLTSMHFYGWKKGLKTGMYYLRTKPAANAIQFTVDKSLVTNSNQNKSPSKSEKNDSSITNGNQSFHDRSMNQEENEQEIIARRMAEMEIITKNVIKGLYDGVTSVQLDDLIAETAASLTTNHPDYALLAGRVAVSKLHKETKPKFSDSIEDLYNNYYNNDNVRSPIISDQHYEIVIKNASLLNEAIIDCRDFTFNYFGFKTLERSYLLKSKGKVIERPQYMIMRVAVGIHGENILATIETYNLLSLKYFTHASPTLFSAATRKPQLSSCFLLSMAEDSIEGIMKTADQCARISKSAGGIGVNIHCIRAKGASIAGTDGTSNGLVPMLRVYNNLARFVGQGVNKRPGSFAIYLEPWHADIFEFLELKKNTGKEETRARDLFYGLWIPDLFMERLESDGDWSLMCPHKCPGLYDVWGDAFVELYEKYEKEGRATRIVKTRSLWFAIIESQVETGTPYMLYKDACNRKSNQQNIGTIRCSNLCTEIVEYSSPDEIAVCNLASIALNQFVTSDNKYDFQSLKAVTKIITNNLNKIIDINYYPLPEAKLSNTRHRPIGIGVQGLADTFILMRFPYESQKAQLLNQQIFETIYYGALEASCDLAKSDGPYETYKGSPVSKGILQYDMWNKTPTNLWDWSKLKEKIAKYGVRNSLLIAPMPTASTAQILGNNESFEPYTSNIYNRRVLSGEFQVVNHHLIHDLVELNLWNENMKNEIIINRGSIQNIQQIPKNIRDLYKTVWEISVRITIDMAADRGAFIDQSQSFNIHVAEPNYGKLTSIHFYGWKKGLKTGMYYLRTKPAANAIQFTVEKNLVTSTDEKKIKDNENYIPNDNKSPNHSENPENLECIEKKMGDMVCSLQNKDECLMCGS